MKSLSIREARKEFARLDELARKHGELLITRNGRPVVRVLPVRPRRPVPTNKELRDSIPFQEVPSEDLLREDRDRR